jgi:hypothetical protein
MTTRRDGIFESERARVTERTVQHHASETVRSRSPAGGEVPRSDYAGKTPRPAGTPTESLPFKHRSDE